MLSVGDILARGAAIVRSNWTLAIYRWVFSLAGGLLVLFGVALPLVTTGTNVMDDWSEDPTQWIERLRSIYYGLVAQPEALGLSVAAGLGLFLLSLLFWAFVEAGTFGILYSSDRQAPPGAKAGDWFRTLSLGDFLGWGRRYLWRFIGLLAIVLFLVFVILLAIGALMAASIGAGRQMGSAAGFGIGCGGILPLTFLMVAVAISFWLACADLVRESSGPKAAFHTGVRILSQRLGAVLLMFLIWFFLQFGLSMLLAGPSFALQGLLGDSFEATVAAEVLVQAMQSFLAQFIHLWLCASAVVMVRSHPVAAPEAPSAQEATA